jgi:preprotein translocase subunit SecD
LLLLFVAVLVGFSVWAVVPLEGDRFGRQGLTLGLDLKGGAYLVYEADLSKKDPSQTVDQVMTSVLSKIERRANAFGVKETDHTAPGRKPHPGPAARRKKRRRGQETNRAGSLLEFKETITDISGQPQTDDKGQYIWTIATAVGSDGRPGIDRQIS